MAAKLAFEPELLPIDSVAGEAALTADRLSAEWLRARFSRSVDWTPEEPMDQWYASELKQMLASVLIPIVMHEQGASIMLTQRSLHVSDHAGQISFPGGRKEPLDASSIETALREAEEEIGLDRRCVEVLGTLPDYSTASGYCVTPVVSLVHMPFEVHADPLEVQEIFEVPLAFLMNGAHHQRRSISLPPPVGRRTFYTMPYQHFFIWGATAGMLRNLFHFLRA